MIIFTAYCNLLSSTDPTPIALTILIWSNCSTFSDVVKVLEDGDLQTLGLLDYDKRLKHSFTAHPKVDPFTGKLIDLIIWYYFLFSPLFSDNSCEPSFRWNVHLWILTWASLLYIPCNYQRWGYAWSCANNNTRICNDAWLCHHRELFYFHGSPFIVPTKGELYFGTKVHVYIFSVPSIYIRLMDAIVNNYLTIVWKIFEHLFLAGSSFCILVYRKWWRMVSLFTSLILQRKLALVFSHAMPRMTNS